MGNSPIEQGKVAGPTEVPRTEVQPEDPAEQDFAPTQMGENPEISNDWWSESTDGQCSETAALFAASQPAPLSIV